MRKIFERVRDWWQDTFEVEVIIVLFGFIFIYPILKVIEWIEYLVEWIKNALQNL